jgi:RNA polymerase sigma factor (TIGR02999 family)
MDGEPENTAATDERPKPTDQWFATLYAELRKLALRELHRAPAGAISPTTLVHELYMKIADRDTLQFPDRSRFLAYGARAMRGLIVDFARHRQAVKRGSGFEITRLTGQVAEAFADPQELSRLSDAIDELAAVDPGLAELVDLKYFCGFSMEEIAQLRGTSQRTTEREWEKARLVLFSQLGQQ